MGAVAETFLSDVACNGRERRGYPRSWLSSGNTPQFRTLQIRILRRFSGSPLQVGLSDLVRFILVHPLDVMPPSRLVQSELFATSNTSADVIT
jgi:hypothetical protein